MNRKEFIKVCGGSCLGLVGLSALLQSCSATHYVQGNVTNNQLQLSKTDFVFLKNDKGTFRKSIIVKIERSAYPIVVYRFSATDYTALPLRCTHQGAELSVHGDLLTCSAHGSEFNNKGKIVQGPAEQDLRPFPVTIDEKNIYIQLS